MEEALLQFGLPVKCAYGDCEAKGFVKPKNYGGWYKSKMWRFKINKRWFCPKHYEWARARDNRFYENYKTPDPYPEAESTVDELYKLLD